MIARLGLVHIHSTKRALPLPKPSMSDSPIRAFSDGDTHPRHYHNQLYIQTNNTVAGNGCPICMSFYCDVADLDVHETNKNKKKITCDVCRWTNRCATGIQWVCTRPMLMRGVAYALLSPAEDVCVCGADRRQAREEPAETAIAVRSDVVSCPGSVQCMSCLAVERGTSCTGKSQEIGAPLKVGEDSVR